MDNYIFCAGLHCFFCCDGDMLGPESWQNHCPQYVHHWALKSTGPLRINCNFVLCKSKKLLCSSFRWRFFCQASLDSVIVQLKLVICSQVLMHTWWRQQHIRVYVLWNIAGIEHALSTYFKFQAFVYTNNFVHHVIPWPAQILFCAYYFSCQASYWGT